MQPNEAPSLHLAELVARTARELGVETAVIGALALAAHNYIRGTNDIDLATSVASTSELRRLADRLATLGCKTELRTPDEEDPLGGVLEVWQLEDEDDLPINPVEVVNFINPHVPRSNPGPAAVRNATVLEEGSSLRYVRLEDLIALKLYSGGQRDRNDVLELLLRNPEADREAVRSACVPFGAADVLEALFQEADQIAEAEH